MIKPASRSTLHDNILAQLVKAIKAGRWQPGEKIPGEQDLARQFQVSRNCIREVLKALGLSGVLEAHPGQGTFLTRDALIKIEGHGLASTLMGDVSLSELREVRRLLEGHTAYLAAMRADDEGVEMLRKSLRSRNPEENHVDSDFRFHKTLSKLADNTLLTNILSSIQSRLDELRSRYSKIPAGVVRNFDEEHAAIYELVKAHKAEEARDAMMLHIDDAWLTSLYTELQEHPVAKKKSS